MKIAAHWRRKWDAQRLFGMDHWRVRSLELLLTGEHFQSKTPEARIHVHGPEFMLRESHHD